MCTLKLYVHICQRATLPPATFMINLNFSGRMQPERNSEKKLKDLLIKITQIIAKQLKSQNRCNIVRQVSRICQKFIQYATENNILPIPTIPYTYLTSFHALHLQTESFRFISHAKMNHQLANKYMSNINLKQHKITEKVSNNEARETKRKLQRSQIIRQI